MNQGIEGIDFISEEDRLRTNTMFSAPNMFYVYYDDNNNIYSITNEKKESGNFVETTEALVKDFLEGKKDYKNFKVKGSRNKQFVENTMHVKSVYKDFSVITPCETTPELAVSIKDNKIVEENIWMEKMGRFRNVIQGSDGAIYISLESPGRILKVTAK